MRQELVAQAISVADALICMIGILYCCVVVTFLAFRKTVSSDDKIEIPFTPRHDKLKGRRIKPIRHTDKSLYEMSEKDHGRY
jgi:hypothetical protein